MDLEMEALHRQGAAEVLCDPQPPKMRTQDSHRGLALGLGVTKAHSGVSVLFLGLSGLERWLNLCCGIRLSCWVRRVRWVLCWGERLAQNPEPS